MMKRWVFLLWVAGTTLLRAAAVDVSSLDELAKVAAQSGNQVRMKPGIYTIDRIYTDNPKTIFRFSGSDNQFNFSGVTIRIDTRVQSKMPRGNAHEHTGILVDGNRLTFSGGLFENIGEYAPPRGINDFYVLGNDNHFIGCRIITRGSSPYGYGDFYGKGRDAATRLQKHCTMAIMGDRTLVDGCDITVHSFGHGIHMHGAQDTVIRNVTMQGALRLTDEIYAETSGLAAKYDHKRMYPPWLKGTPIPKGKMQSLTEDGIRAYLDGKDRDGKNRRTGHVTIENCTVKRMRGGITVTMAKSGTITNCTVLDSGWHAYSVPAKGIVRNCKGNAAFGMLLYQPYSERRDTDIELELIDSESEMGDHPLAEIAGSGHRIKITYTGKRNPKKLRPIIIGTTGDRYTKANTDPEKLRTKNAARDIVLINQTPHPIHFTEFAANNKATTRGQVTDHGTANLVTNE